MNSVLARATPRDLKAARTINLSCLTSFQGCHSLCELMPDAFRYRQEHTATVCLAEEFGQLEFARPHLPVNLRRENLTPPHLAQQP